ncbi:MFS transporter [Desulfosediminicola flagellatus]|uniref:MFS transporter n=1 Tax=Desulfosediminicola flagellatus TaxID=2569541 RepID=UPI0010AC6537|nr:MFS transporter [Desulfosediminicola flagellatus]
MKNIKNNPMYFYLMILTICASSGLHVWRTLFDNFAIHAIGLDGHHIGILQSIREIPGFLSLLVVYILLFIREHKLSALAVLILGLGVALTGYLPSFSGIIFTTLIMSFGFHYFETTNQSLTLQHFDKIQAPLVFGRLRALASGSCIVISGLMLLISPILSYKQLYIVFGGIIMIVAGWSLTRNPAKKDTVPQHKKMILRKKYWLYYALTFMAGARRQIFIAFAVFLLVKKFDYSVQQIALLFLINNAVNYFLAPFIGKCINRFGERKVLSLEYGSLIVIFIAYALVDNKLIAAFLYIADHIFFNFSIAIRTFFQKIADPADIAPSMAVGFTINHIAAVVLPAIGGLLWLVDYRIPFIAGAVLSAVSLFLVQIISSQIALHGTE